MRLPVYDASGKRTQEILEFDENIFGKEVRKVVLKEAILMYEARQRQGTHSTKTRKECAGSGRKLWRQKGTGRARVGAARAPHWRGGGVVFGPKPRSYAYSMTKKARKIALDSAWLAKFLDKEILVLENFELQDVPKTAKVFATLKQLNIESRRTIFGISAHDFILLKSVRNLPQTSVEQVANFNPYLIVNNQRVVLLRPAFEELIQSRGGTVKVLNRKDLYS